MRTIAACSVEGKTCIGRRAGSDIRRPEGSFFLPMGEDASGRVCACSLHSRLVFVAILIQPFQLVMQDNFIFKS